MEKLYIVHYPEIYKLLIFLSVCVVLPMFILSRRIPMLSSVGHSDTRWIDGLRGIAAVSVALNHAPLVLINLLIVPKIFYFDLVESQILFFFGAVGVQLFFCITGFLFAGKIFSSKNLNWEEFYLKRFWRTVPAYLFAAILSLLIALWFTWPLAEPAWEIATKLPALFSFSFMPLPNINSFEISRLLGVSWTLAIEWRFYFVLPMVCLLMRSWRGLMMAILIVLAIADLYISKSSTWSFFIPGVLCSILQPKQFNRYIRSASSCIALMAIVTMFYRYGNKANYGLEQWWNICILFTALTVARPRVLSIKMFVAMGSISYSFYLLHAITLFFVFGCVNRYVVNAGTLSLKQFSLVCGATLALATLFSTVSYIFVERRFMYRPVAPK